MSETQKRQIKSNFRVELQRLIESPSYLDAALQRHQLNAETCSGLEQHVLDPMLYQLARDASAAFNRYEDAWDFVESNHRKLCDVISQSDVFWLESSEYTIEWPVAETAAYSLLSKAMLEPAVEMGADKKEGLQR